MSEEFTLDEFYDVYPRIEEAFRAALDVSLEPRGPELLYDMVDDLGLASGASVVDVGCGEGKQALKLADRFDVAVAGFDPVPRHIQLANEALRAAADRRPELRERVRFEIGTAEALPVADGSAEFVWCKDVLVHVAALERAYGEFRRILRENGRVLVYQSCFATEPLAPREEAWLRRTPGVMAANADYAHTESAIAGAGLRVDECIDVGIEWREWSQEQTGDEGRQLLHAARLLRDPARYITQFGQTAYDIMLDDCLWHVYHMIGKVGARVYLLSLQ